jgi:predicted short-subunit dehydrogenase-like oxidoreductase (DUF2520 family)
MRDTSGMPDAEVPPPLAVGLVGPGRAGSVVAAALAAAGHPISGWSGRDPVSALGVDRMARLLPGIARVPLADLVTAGGIVLLAVPDAVLAGVVASIATVPPASRAATVYWHLSGATGIRALAPLGEPAGARLLALHPAMTFTGTVADLPQLRGVTWACTCDDDSVELAHTLVRALGGRPVELTETDRPRYHAALSHASNFFTVLQSQAADLLRSIGVTDPASMLGPLVRSALTNALADPPVYTGPISRGDVATIRTHLAAFDDPDTSLTYAALSTAVLHRLSAAGTLDGETAGAIAAALATRPHV